MEILLGAVTSAWFFTVGGVGYCIWRYCYKPWVSLRVDIATLHAMISDQQTLIKGLQDEVGLRKVINLTDERTAEHEQRERMRILARAVNGG